MSSPKKNNRPTGLEGLTKNQGGAALRLGYTTGTCAAAAAKAGAAMLLSGKRIDYVKVQVPKGIILTLQVHDISLEGERCSCAIQKDAGDDPDVTDGIYIYALVEKKTEKGICLLGGEGVGRVTLPGLPCKVGESAINPVPQQMILKAVEEEMKRFGYEGGLSITISVPEGEKVAKKTFNPRLGIIGGISILGTTGLVEPMSERALLDTIHLEMKQRLSLHPGVLLAIQGNYSLRFVEKELSLPPDLPVVISNYVGESIDYALELGAGGLLFIAHIGKFVKVAGGIMNTHSHQADCRMEILCSAAIRAGGSLSLAKEILGCMTTEEALKRIQRENLMELVIEDLLSHMELYLTHHSYEKIRLGAMLFSEELGYLGCTSLAEELLCEVREGL